MSGREGRGERRGEAEEFSASLFPGLCKGLIKYGWCLEQSRGKWDSTNSTSSPGRPTPLRWSSAVSFSSSVSPSSSSPLLPRLIHLLPPFPSLLHFLFFRPVSLPSVKRCDDKVRLFSSLGLSVHVFSLYSFSLFFLCISSSSSVILHSSLFLSLSSLSFLSLPVMTAELFDYHM